jgi:pyridoxamine 5'-phosphate oxidase
MNAEQIMNEIQSIIDDARTAVIATVDNDNSPHMRWVTPGLLKDHPRSVFIITSPSFAKAIHAMENPTVEWMFQTRALDKVVNTQGTASILDNPSIKSEVLEVVGARLRTLWHLSEDQHSMIVMETVLEKAAYFLPAKGTKETVSFTD